MRAIALLCLLTALAACADGVSVTRTYVRQRGVPDQVALAATQPATQAVLRDAPFAEANVLAAMRRHTPWRTLNFTAEPPPGDPYGYKVVLVFGGVPTGSSFACPSARDGALRAAGRRGSSVYGAFCVGDILLTEAAAEAPPIGSADDPRFGRLIGDLLTAILPTRDPLSPDPGCNRPPC